MKKVMLATILALWCLPALADDSGGFSSDAKPPPASEQNGGYRGISDAHEITTVKKLQALPDGSWVSIKGNILKKVADNLYQLRDETGTVNLHIDPAIWKGQEVKPDDLVTLSGNLSGSGDARIVKVKQLRNL